MLLKCLGSSSDGNSYILETEGMINQYSLSSTKYNGNTDDNKICIAWLDMDKS